MNNQLFKFEFCIFEFNFKFSKTAILRNLPLYAMAVLVVILSIDCFYSYPKYDSFEFFNLWIRKINLETFNNLEYLKLSNHRKL